MNVLLNTATRFQCYPILPGDWAFYTQLYILNMSGSDLDKKARRPRLLLVSDDMRRLCGLLSEELFRWPAVSMRPMFGMRAFYRGTVVFAMLPDKRALENPRAIGYKLASEGQSKEGEKWNFADLESEHDIATALACLDKAYRKAWGAPRK